MKLQSRATAEGLKQASGYILLESKTKLILERDRMVNLSNTYWTSRTQNCRDCKSLAALPAVTFSPVFNPHPVCFTQPYFVEVLKVNLTYPKLRTFVDKKGQHDISYVKVVWIFQKWQSTDEDSLQSKTRKHSKSLSSLENVLSQWPDNFNMSQRKLAFIVLRQIKNVCKGKSLHLDFFQYILLSTNMF